MSTSDPRPVGLVYTGGTFGMTPSDEGYVPSTDLPERVERDIEGLHAQGMPAVEWIAHEAGPPINSSDTTPAFWHRLAGTLRNHAGRCRGFVIIHGTDTLAWTGSALSFLLPERAFPVIVTGSSKPLGEAGSDAPHNLLNALRVIAEPDWSGVGLVFGDVLLRANRATKRHGSADQPFSSPACEPVARIGTRVEVRPDAAAECPPPGSAPTLRAPESVRVAQLAVYPGIDAALLEGVLGSGVQGIVLEAYPAGLGPGSDTAFVDAIARASARGVVIGAVSQAREGRIRMGRYATSTPLAEAGVAAGADMTREAALAKLHSLLAAGTPAEEARTRFGQNLQGELTPE